MKQSDANEAMARLKTLLKRKDEFGQAGETEVRWQLQTLTDLYVIPDDQPELVEIEEFLKARNAVKCLPLLTRLRLLAGAGMFVTA